MRKLLIAISFLGIVACNRSGITIQGKISNSDGKVYLGEMDLLSVKNVDSTTVGKNGRFTFHEKIQQPTFYQLKLKNNQSVQLLLNPGDKVKLEGDGLSLLSTIKVDGSAQTERITELNKRLAATVAKLDSLSSEYDSYANKPGNDSMLARLAKEYESTLQQHRTYTIGFILQDINSLANLTALYQEISPGTYLLNRYRDLQYFKIVTDSLTKNYPKLTPVKVLADDYSKRFAQYKSNELISNAKNISYGLPEVNLPDIEGDTVSLSSLKGKYVLLCFWASWDDNSIRQNLQLKDVYQRYHRKGFEIYQVSLDKSYDNWKKEVHFDELPWINVCDSTYPASRAAASYNVTEIPLNFLLNKQQDEILGKNLTADQLELKLSGLYN